MELNNSILSLVVASIFAFLYTQENAKGIFLKILFLLTALLFISIAFFVNYKLNNTLTTSKNVTSYPAYNVITSNVPLNCANTGVLSGVGVTGCGTTTEVTQYPAYNITIISNPNVSYVYTLNNSVYGFGLIIAGIGVFIIVYLFLKGISVI